MDDKQKITKFDSLANEALEQLKTPPGANWPFSRVGSYGLFFSVLAICITFLIALKMVINFINSNGGF